MERLQQVVCGRPAEPEGAVRPEEALPEGGGGPALSLPGEHTHSGSSLQQPCLPSGMEPWALVSGKWELLGKRRETKIQVVSLLPPRGSQLFIPSWESHSHVNGHFN